MDGGCAWGDRPRLLGHSCLSLFLLSFMIGLFWNCQGAASREFIRVLKNFVNTYRLDMISIFEPRISGGNADDACKKIGFANWVRVEANGFSGGIWVLWNETLHVEVKYTNPQFILMQVKEGHEEPYWVSAVYVSPSKALRRKLWMELDATKCNIEAPWISIGDYNATINAEERSSGNDNHKAGCNDFQEWINRECMIDMGFRGQKFTWARGTEETMFKGARLDRAVCNVEWCERFTNS